MNWRTMRRVVAAGLLIASSWLFAGTAQAYDAELQALAGKLVTQLEAAGQKSGTVIDFADLQGTPNELGRFLAQELSAQLVASSKQMSFVDRANLQTLLRENKLSVEGLVNPESTKKLGNLIGIDTVIFGTTTPLGDKIRLSVRGVAVETGKIIASQSTMLPTDNGLAELYTRGVASAPGGEAKPTADPRARFRRDSIKITAKEVVLGSGNLASVTFTLENLSGVGFDSAIMMGPTSIGACVGREHTSSGLKLSPTPAERVKEIPGLLQYFPANGKIVVTIELNCPTEKFSGVASTDVTLSLLVGTPDNAFVMPLSVSGVPVRRTGTAR